MRAETLRNFLIAAPFEPPYDNAMCILGVQTPPQNRIEFLKKIQFLSGLWWLRSSGKRTGEARPEFWVVLIWKR